MKVMTSMADMVTKSDQTTKSVSERVDRAAKRGRERAAQTKGQTLRLNVEAWRQLRYLATDEDRTAHDLLIEAVNDLFKKYGKTPIA